MVGAFFYYYDRSGALEDQVRAYESLQFTTDESEANQDLLQENHGTYMSLVQQGYIGTPERLQWLETLRRLGTQYNLPGVEFTLESSVVTEENVDPFWRPTVKTLSTDMNVNMQLTHEGDLYRLLNGLAKEANGLFSVESCRLRWLDSYGEEAELTRLRGDCQLRWYTLTDATNLGQGL